MTKTITIKGMMCPHCKASVEKALQALDGAETVTVSLEAGTAVVEGNAADEAMKQAVTDAGFEVVEMA